MPPRELDQWHLLDGHQRVRVLKLLQAEGYTVPAVPAVQIHATSKADAKRKLLGMASQYGTVEPDGLYEYMAEAGVSMEELRDDFWLPEISLDKFEAEYFSLNADIAMPTSEAAAEAAAEAAQCEACGQKLKKKPA